MQGIWLFYYGVYWLALLMVLLYLMQYHNKVHDPTGNSTNTFIRTSSANMKRILAEMKQTRLKEMKKFNESEYNLRNEIDNLRHKLYYLRQSHLMEQSYCRRTSDKLKESLLIEFEECQQSSNILRTKIADSKKEQFDTEAKCLQSERQLQKQLQVLKVKHFEHLMTNFQLQSKLRNLMNNLNEAELLNEICQKNQRYLEYRMHKVKLAQMNCTNELNVCENVHKRFLFVDHNETAMQICKIERIKELSKCNEITNSFRLHLLQIKDACLRKGTELCNSLVECNQTQNGLLSKLTALQDSHKNAEQCRGISEERGNLNAELQTMQYCNIRRFKDLIKLNIVCTRLH